MSKKISGKEYEAWSKEELIKEIVKIKSTTYGLVWHRDVPEEKIDILVNPDARTPNEIFPNEMTGKPFPVLKEVSNKAIQSDKSKLVNLLIEGDNYHSLAVLNFTHREAVDLIYIDPPYNTGNNDFIYNDKLIDKEDSFRHSKWLSFMEKRLKLARFLLNEAGVIFISIDDNEQAPLKMLCDEIFGENNFIANVSRLTKSTSFRGNYFAPSIDYILCYAKNIEALPNFVDRSDIKEEQYPKIENIGTRKGERYRDDIAFYLTTLETRPNQRYFIECPDGSKVLPPGKTFPPKVPVKGDGVWRWSYANYLEKKDLIVFKKTNRSPLIDEKGAQAKWNLYTKSYLEDRKAEGKLPRNFLDKFLNRLGSSSLKGMDINFDFSKPVELIKYLIDITNKDKDIRILDFFAGSGTTGQAVLELNKEDGGHRNFILCTNNENEICKNVCYPRLKQVMHGYQNQKGDKVDGFGGNLKYFITDFVKAEPTDTNKRKLVKESTDMLRILENAFELIKEETEFKIFKNADKYLGIIFYEEAIEDYKKVIKKFDGHFNTYVFSSTNHAHEDRFEDVKTKVTLCAIPEVILKVYREIFKDK